MKKICCFLHDFQEYGIFIGCQLLIGEGEPLKKLKTRKFYNLISRELEKYLDLYEYSKENLEKWFER
jgi:hypothetical protein